MNYQSDFEFSNGFNFDWKKIKSRTKNFIVYHSNNDPYVDVENGRQLAKHIGTKLTFIPNAGHFNRASGYTEFAHLLNNLQKYL